MDRVGDFGDLDTLTPGTPESIDSFNIDAFSGTGSMVMLHEVRQPLPVVFACANITTSLPTLSGIEVMDSRMGL